GSTTRYGWDGAGRLASVDHSVLGRAAFDRDAAGRLVSATAGGLIQAWEHRDGFVVAHTVTDTEGATRTEIGRDELGRVTRVRRDDGASSTTVDYVHDGANQLLEARTATATGSTRRRWSYDAAGRLTRESTLTEAGSTDVEHLH